MFTLNQWDRASRRAPVLALASMVLLPLVASAQPGEIDAQAKALLKASTDFLAIQKQFMFETSTTLEIVLTSGQKLQFDNATKQSIQRPNKLRAERVGDLIEQVFYYDGKSLTLSNPADGVYATVAAPDTLEGMLDFARDSLDIVAPASDLLYEDAFAILMEDVTSGFVVGKSVVGGVRCDHLAFRASDVDWQIWIQEGSQPLPRKFVITTRDVINAPQFAVEVTKWDLGPRFSAETFSFAPPKGAKQIEFLPVDTASQ